MRGNFCFIKNKLRAIYTSPLQYLTIFLEVSFLVIYMYANKTDPAFSYVSTLKKDLFLWIICIPIMVVQHKVIVFSTYYNCISRVCRKRQMIFVDYFTLAVSTCISLCIVLGTPLLFLLEKKSTFVCADLAAELLFLLTRYLLLGLLVQYIIYSILYAFPKLQKRGGSICALPFVLYFIFTSPMEIMRIYGQHMPLLDFSAGGSYVGGNYADGNYVFAANGAVLWGSVFFSNIHLVGYLALTVWITTRFLAKRWEFCENESVSAP